MFGLGAVNLKPANIILLASGLFALSVAELTPQAGSPTDVPPLFASSDLLVFTLQADFRALDRDRGDERQEHSGTLGYEDENGNAVQLDLRLRTRGNFRLSRSVCEFPNVRLNFRNEDTPNTLFAGQDKLKLVAHCQNGRNDYEQYALKEYLIYRIYGLFTEMSFKVRLARITYIDNGGAFDSLTRYGFLIEDEDQMAARNRAVVLDAGGVHSVEVDDEDATLFEVFQYFIGNADWSVSALHNVKVLSRVGDPLPAIVPYDFDFSGVVDARYAMPPPALDTYSVKERVFIGPCRPVYDLNRVVGLFNQKRADIYRLVTSQPGLSERSVERTLEYFDDFYECVNEDRCMRRELVRGCPGGTSNFEH